MFHFKPNLPTWERMLRLALGAMLVGAAFAGLTLGLPTWLLIASGVGVALTAVFGFCPACALVGRKVRSRP